MSESTYTFDQLPGIVAMLANEIKELKQLVKQSNASQKPDPEEMMDIGKALCA